MSSEFFSNHGFTAEIAESAEEPRGIEIRLRRGCLAGAFVVSKAVEIEKRVLEKKGRVVNEKKHNEFGG